MDKRTLLAVVLSLVVLIGWSMFQKPPVPQNNLIAENETVKTAPLVEYKEEKNFAQKTPVAAISHDSKVMLNY